MLTTRPAHPRRRGRALRALATAVLTAALAITANVLPATAATPQGSSIAQSDVATSHRFHVTIQTRAANGPEAYEIRKLGDTSTPQCHPVAYSYYNLEHPNTFVSRVFDLDAPAKYEILSFGDQDCKDASYLIGSRGVIDTGVWSKWTFYANRPPKLSL